MSSYRSLSPTSNHQPQSPSPSSSPSSHNDDHPLHRLRANDLLVCISDRVDEDLIFPYIDDGALLDDVVGTILGGTSVLVVGEPGIGKRTLSLGLARRLANASTTTTTTTTTTTPTATTTTTSRSNGHGHSHGHLSDHRGVDDLTVYTLSPGRQFWACSQSEEGRFRSTDLHNGIREVFRDVERAGPGAVVLCIDDVDMLSVLDRLVLKERPLHARSDSESVLSLENMLRFLLFNRRVLCLCTCVSAAYDRLVHLDSFYDEKFSKSFRVLHKKPPAPRRAAGIVRAHRHRIEAELDVTIAPAATDAATAIAAKLLTHRPMPDAALDLLLHACASALTTAEHTAQEDRRHNLHIGGRVIVDQTHVAHVAHQWCGISMHRVEQCYSK